MTDFLKLLIFLLGVFFLFVCCRVNEINLVSELLLLAMMIIRAIIIEVIIIIYIYTSFLVSTLYEEELQFFRVVVL